MKTHSPAPQRWCISLHLALGKVKIKHRSPHCLLFVSSVVARVADHGYQLPYQTCSTRHGTEVERKARSGKPLRGGGGGGLHPEHRALDKLEKVLAGYLFNYYLPSAKCLSWERLQIEIMSWDCEELYAIC